MCTFREIWIPPIILPSDYVTVSIRSCPEVGDADYIIGLLDITEYRPVGRGVRRVRSFPSQAPEVHTFLLINYLKQRELILFLFLFAECAVKLKIL